MTTKVWTDELFEEMSSEYLAKINALPEEERAGVTMEIVAEVAKAHGIATNSFRMKLSQANLYIKQNKAKPATKTEGAAKTGGTRVSKEGSQKELIDAFSDAGLPSDFLDSEIITKLTGKAAQHLAAAVRSITK